MALQLHQVFLPQLEQPGLPLRKPKLPQQKEVMRETITLTTSYSIIINFFTIINTFGFQNFKYVFSNYKNLKISK